MMVKNESLKNQKISLAKSWKWKKEKNENENNYQMEN